MFSIFNVICLCILSLNTFQALAASKYLDITLDKDSYFSGEVAKLSAMVKNVKLKPGYDFIIEGTHTGGPIFFRQYENIFIGRVGPLAQNNSIKVDLKLQLRNKAVVNSLEQSVKLINLEIQKLLDDGHSESSDIIRSLRNKAVTLTLEIQRQISLLELVSVSIPVSPLACNFSQNFQSEYKQAIPQRAKRTFVEARSLFRNINGSRYEFRFTTHKLNKIRFPKRIKTGFVTDYCTEEGDIELSDDMLPSWEIARTVPRRSTYESSLRCFKDDGPVKCRATFFLSAGLCDGRHSTSHITSRPLGKIQGMTQFRVYDVPATEVGLPYIYVAPDTAGDVMMNWTFFVKDDEGNEQRQEAPYLLRVFVPNLQNLNETVGLNTYLTFNNITSHGFGTYGVDGMGASLHSALMEYVNDALLLNISNSPQRFYPLNSEGVSLQFGGLFDVERNWNHPHKRHRQGEDIDIGMSLLKNHPNQNELMDILERRLIGAGFTFDVRFEGPKATAEEVNKPLFHWHARKQKVIENSNGGSTL